MHIIHWNHRLQCVKSISLIKQHPLCWCSNPFWTVFFFCNWLCKFPLSESYNHRQNCCDTLRRVVYIRPPLPQYNVESSIFLHSLLIDPNIEWWGRGRYGMLEDSLDFMSKKAWFQHVKLNVNTVELIHHFWGSVPTTFDEHCRTGSSSSINSVR